MDKQKSEQELILKSAELSRASPQLWNEFLAAFRQYTAERKNQLVAAPLEALPTAQGDARACATLEKLFGDAANSADRIVARRS